MEDEEILESVLNKYPNRTDEQIGEFVRRALTENTTAEDLENDMGLRRPKQRGGRI